MTLTEYLISHKEDIVKEVEVVTPGWSNTYESPQEVGRIEVIDFDSLMAQIEIFEEQFKNA